MENLKESIDYSTEGIVQAINNLLEKVDSLSYLVVELADKNKDEDIKQKAMKVIKM